MPAWKVLPLWVLLTTIGLACDPAVAILHVGLQAAWLGFAQWLLLRRLVPRAGLWIVANVIGRAVGAAWSARIILLPEWIPISAPVVAIALLQAPVIAVRLGSILAWVAASVTAAAAADLALDYGLDLLPGPLGLIPDVVHRGALHGAVTGSALVALLRARQRPADSLFPDR